MSKKKKISWSIGGIILIAVIITAVIILKSGMVTDQKFNADGEVEVHYKSAYVDAVPEDFRTKYTKEMAAEMFNITSETGEEREKDTIELKAKFIPNGDAYKAEGTGILTISSKDYPFHITDSYLKKETLKSGDHLIWGSINGDFKDVNGEEREMILNISTVIETEEVFYYATLGGLVMSFGDFGFETKEIRDILLKNPI
ncbi:hypothetical protein [Paenibacillus sp. Marseille-Q4541]|uniref:hypothetical protein n=1 Tax=Paenibacillus sp. Marseille-Q4541 TaxID=2831522 RepID=UPI001BA97501|nr:hypothetical protein [Paenibacillus sp. Marseille-Q4541]